MLVTILRRIFVVNRRPSDSGRDRSGARIHEVIRVYGSGHGNGGVGCRCDSAIDRCPTIRVVVEQLELLLDA